MVNTWSRSRPNQMELDGTHVMAAKPSELQKCWSQLYTPSFDTEEIRGSNPLAPTIELSPFRS